MISAGCVYKLIYIHTYVYVRIIITEYEAVDVKRSGEDTGGIDWREEKMRENGVNTVFIYKNNQ